MKKDFFICELLIVQTEMNRDKKKTKQTTYYICIYSELKSIYNEAYRSSTPSSAKIIKHFMIFRIY